MPILRYLFLSILMLSVLSDCKKEDPAGPAPDLLQLVSIRVGTLALQPGTVTEQAAIDQPVVAVFSKTLNTATVPDAFKLTKADGTAIPVNFFFLDNDKSVSAQPVNPLEEGAEYQVELGATLQGTAGENFPGLTYRFRTAVAPLTIVALDINGQDMLQSGKLTGVPRAFEINIEFSHGLDLQNFKSKFFVSTPTTALNFDVDQPNGNTKRIRIRSQAPSPHFSLHTLRILNTLTATTGNVFGGLTRRFYTEIDNTPKFPLLSDDELLTKIQEQTFRYFWDFGHPVSGLSRERNTSGNTVTSGGSGFGLMAMIVGMERNFISRQEGMQRLATTLDFLENADRFHGAWSHWLHGGTGKVIPFSANDDGGDLVETSYLAMGLLTMRQYLNPQDVQEAAMIQKINALWQSIEWDWYRQGGQNVLYWHWSPNFQWVKNHKIGGYNEALITYIMAAASPTHSIPVSVYHEGWARNGNMVNGNNYYDIKLPLGNAYGGPLFFEQYTYLGIDPRNLSDQYANYWEQCVNHTLINREHCVRNPNNYVGYSADCWGLTASDGNTGYSAHSPTNDRGVITPTAALASFPYTPEYSMDALKHFYYILGDKLWGEYGFYDAFNPTEGWTAASFLAIDQGPIIIQIENHRTGLLWNLFMSCPEVQAGLTKLGFSY